MMRFKPFAATVPVLVMTFLLPTADRVVLAQDTVAMFKIEGPLSEVPKEFDLGELFGGKRQPNMFQLLQTLRDARNDGTLKAVIFDIENAQLGFAQIQELRRQFKALKAVEKDVWVFCETLSTGNYVLASAASNLVMMPTGELDLTGMYAEGAYFKNMLDNVRLEADIVHIGDYKSAGEPFYRTGPSKEAEEQTNRLIDSLFGQIIDEIADSRQLKPETVKELIDQGLFSAKEALEADLIDKIQYREDFVKAIKSRYGEDVKVDEAYGSKDKLDVNFENPLWFFGMMKDLFKQEEETVSRTIAVVHVEGAITTGEREEGLFGGGNAGSDTIRLAIAKAAHDEEVAALVLRVDSPGGSAIASDVICEAVKRFKDSDRPVVVSMGNVAASGGYYVSALGDAIFAEPGTITGSIGVVGGKFVTKGLWDWVGITGHEYKRGKRADIMSSNRRFDETERKIITDMMLRVYADFKGRVMEGREDKLEQELESIAGGRVYSGKEAKELGLVDQLGGLNEAIKYAADKAEISDYDVTIYPKRKSFAEVMSELFGQDTEKEFVFARALNSGHAGIAGLPGIAAALEAVRVVDPQKARMMQQFLLQLEMLNQENVLLLSPLATTVFK